MNILELDSYDLADAVKFNDTLNPAIWQGEKMRPEVRERLLAIAEDFKQFLGLSDLEVKDITVSGSNAAYTYTPHSDIDVHLVVDIPQADSDEVYRELFDAKKYQYNDLHDYKIKNYDVELYVENANKPPHSAGIYSLLNDDWIKIPRKIRSDVDDEAVKSKFEDLGHRIESAVKTNDYEKIDQLAKKVKSFRQAGLDAHGELGPENLAYKMLRTQGVIKQLYDARNSALDKKLSLKEKVKQPVKYGFTSEDLDSDGVLMTRPTNCSSEAAVPETAPSDEEVLKDFIKFCIAELKIEQLPKIKLRKDPQWSKVHKTFGRYTNDTCTLEVAWGQRHIMDVLRTVAHELTHKHQHERDGSRMGPDAGETGSPWENEANARAGILMRDYGRLHPELFVAGQAEQLHGDEVNENFANYFKTSAPQVKPTKGSMNIAGYRVDYDASTKSIVISKNGQVLHKEGGTGQGRPAGIDAIASRARRIINQLEGDVVDEGVKEKLGALAAAACIAGTPGCATTDIRTAQDIGRTAQSVSKLTKQGVKAELDQELRNYLRAKQGKSGEGNLSTIYKIEKELQKESASGYIPTKKQAKDPRYSMALTQDIKPGQVGKEANKLGLETDKQGHPKLLMKDLRNALREFKETGQLPKPKAKFGYTGQPLTQEPGGIEDALGNQEATGPEFPPEFPKGTTKINVSDLTDWYRLGMDISDMDDAEPEDYNQGPPQTIVVYPNDDAETYYNKQLNRLGLKTSKASGSTKLSEEQLDEVKMSPGALRKFASSPEAEGIMAGFEAELIFRDTQGDDNDGDYEADYDADERARTIDDVIDFFSNDDYGYGLSPRQADRLRDDLDNAYFEWRDEQIMNDFERESDDLVREVWLEERPMVERIHSALVDGMGLTDAEADKIIAAGDKAPRFTKHADQIDYKEEHPEYAQYLEAADIADSILDEEVEASLDNQDKYYDAALDTFRDNYDADDSGFFSDMGWRWMSSIANEFNLDWPIMSGSGNNYGTRSWDEIADNLSETLGMPVKVGYGYHSAPRKPGQYVLEPDSSLSPDDSEDYGLELVSPPMPLNQAIEQLNAVVDWANSDGNAYTNSSTGLHMGVSIPFKGGDVDYVKLALFLGDQYVLEKFGRAANTYCDSALKKLKQNVAGSKNRGDDKIMSAMELMKNNLIELAQRYVQQGVGNSKYTSAHIKPGYIEFRSPGGDYLAKGDEEIGALEDTMRRFAYAMYLAGRPDLERNEYYKKLYKLIAPEGNKDLEMFAKFSSGEITAEELKKQWAEKVIAKEVPITGKEKGNWVLYNNATQKPVQGATFGNYSEIDAWERAKAKYSTPAESMEEFKKAYTLADSSANNGRWDIVERDTDRVIDVIDSPTRGQASDEANDRQYEESWFIRPHVEFAKPEKPEPKLSRRAQLAKQIAQPADYVIINKHSGLPFYTFRASSQSQAVDFGVTYLRDKGLDLDNFSVQKASNVKQTIDNRVDSKQLQQRVHDESWTGRYEIVDRRTGEVVLRYRAADADDAGDGFNNWLRNQGLPTDTENYGYRPEQTVAPSTNPNPTVQDPQQVRMPNGIPVWELFDRETGSVLHAIADHTQSEAHQEAMAWLRSYGAEDPDTYSERFGVRPRMLQPGERNLAESADPEYEARLRELIATLDKNLAMLAVAKDPKLKDLYYKFKNQKKQAEKKLAKLGAVTENFETDAEKAMRALNMAAKKLGYPNYSAVPEGQRNTCRQMAVYSLNTDNASHPNFLDKKVKNEG